VVSLRLLGQEVFLVPLTQQGANTSGALKPCQSITFFTVRAWTQKEERGKADEGRRVRLAHGAQEIIR